MSHFIFLFQGGSLPSPSPGGLPSHSSGPPTSIAAPLFVSGSLGQTSQQPETTYLYIPASSVGAMIGNKVVMSMTLEYDT